MKNLKRRIKDLFKSGRQKRSEYLYKIAHEGKFRHVPLTAIDLQRAVENRRIEISMNLKA